MPLDAEAMAASVVLAIKTALVPVQVKLLAMHDQVIGLEARLAELNLIRERMAIVETKSATVNLLEKGEKGEPGRDGMDGKDGAPGRDGLDGKDGANGPPGEAGKDGAAGLDGKDGKDGSNGLDGKDGAPGIDGRDGLNGVQGPQGLNGRDGTLENMKIVQLDDRTWQMCFKNGDPIDGGILRFDVELYRGVWVDNHEYVRGDCTTWGGSEWHCNETTTTRPGESTKAWTLKVKRGRDGRDGKDATQAPAQMAVVRTK
jgi:Collagen triple helix repeat (20 copies)